jgi:hypothetical protein
MTRMQLVLLVALAPARMTRLVLLGMHNTTPGAQLASIAQGLSPVRVPAGLTGETLLDVGRVAEARMLLLVIE